MKLKYFIIIFITIVINMYLIFIWNPGINSGGITVSAYKNDDTILGNQVDEIGDSLEKESFYLEQGELLENLNEEDVQELNNILNNLSTSDLSKWLQLKQDGNNDNLIEFFKLIKKRMSQHDYDKIKAIMGKILDVDRIESEIIHNYI